MKAYKISDNGICANNFKFEIGKTYTQKGKLELCKNGFHFCKNPDNLFMWYFFNPNTTVIFEVEVLGEVIDSEDNDKSVTNKLKILRIVKKEEYSNVFNNIKFEFNKNNTIFHRKYSNGSECWKEYDENGNMIHHKDSNGYEYWKEYDNNNNLIHYKDSDKYEYWKEYDNNNNLIHYKDSDKYEYWNEYNNNNLIHHKDSNGFEYWKEYDKNNNLIHRKDSNGFECWREYDENGNIIYRNNFN